MEMDIENKNATQNNSNNNANTTSSTTTILETFDSSVNYKGKLLEYFQKKKLSPPLFDTNPSLGWFQCAVILPEPDHHHYKQQQPEMTTNNNEFIGEPAPNKKLAEHRAAFSTLKYLYESAMRSSDVDGDSNNKKSLEKMMMVTAVTTGISQIPTVTSATATTSSTQKAVSSNSLISAADTVLAAPVPPPPGFETLKPQPSFSQQQHQIHNQMNSTAIKNIITSPALSTITAPTTLIKSNHIQQYQQQLQHQDSSSPSSSLLTARNWKGDLLEYCQVLKLPFPELSTTDDGTGIGFICRVTFTQNPVLPFLLTASSVSSSASNYSSSSGGSLVTEQQMIDKMYMLFPSSNTITSTNDTVIGSSSSSPTSAIGVIASDIFPRKKEAEQHACYLTHKRLLFMLNSLGILNNNSNYGGSNNGGNSSSMSSQTTTTESIHSLFDNAFPSSPLQLLSLSHQSKSAESEMLSSMPSIVDYAYSFAAGTGLTKSLRRRKKLKATANSSNSNNSSSDVNHTLLSSPPPPANHASFSSTSSSRSSSGNSSVNSEHELVHRLSTAKAAVIAPAAVELSATAKEYRPPVLLHQSPQSLQPLHPQPSPPYHYQPQLPFLKIDKQQQTPHMPSSPIPSTAAVATTTTHPHPARIIASSINNNTGVVECDDGISVATSVFNSLFESSINTSSSSSSSSNHESSISIGSSKIIHNKSNPSK